VSQPTPNLLTAEKADLKHDANCVFYEKVPVFQKPFRLLQDAVLNGTPQAQVALRGKENVAIKGTLEYQACDNKQCFNPMSVPLSWTLSVKALPLQRPTPPKTSAK